MRAARSRIVAGSLLVLVLLHNDFWFWHRLHWLGGLPAGLVYHLAFCVACAVVYCLLMRGERAEGA